MMSASTAGQGATLIGIVLLAAFIGWMERRGQSVIGQLEDEDIR